MCGLDQFGEHCCSAVGKVLSFDDVFERGKLVDLDAVEGHDQFLVLAQSDLVGSSSSFTSFAHAFADVERDTPRGALHLVTKISFPTGELGDNAAYLSIEP